MDNTCSNDSAESLFEQEKVETFYCLRCKKLWSEHYDIHIQNIATEFVNKMSSIIKKAMAKDPKNCDYCNVK